MMKLQSRLIIPILLSTVTMVFVAAQSQPIQEKATTPQKEDSSDREIGKSYATLRPDDKE